MLLGASTFVRTGASQLADVPVGFFILAAVALVLRANGNRPALALAGFAAGLAAWTKNEGELFIVALGVGVALVAWRTRGAREAAKDVAFVAAGALPLLAVLAAFKLALAPANDLLSGQSTSATIDRLTSPSRYGTTLYEFVHVATRFPLPLLAIYGLALGRGHGPEGCRPGQRALPLAVLGLMLTGFFFVYVTTPIPLQEHIDSSLRRLFVQLLPLALLGYFLIVRSPAARES
jgi:hypothetical protein